MHGISERKRGTKVRTLPRKLSFLRYVRIVNKSWRCLDWQNLTFQAVTKVIMMTFIRFSDTSRAAYVHGYVTRMVLEELAIAIAFFLSLSEGITFEGMRDGRLCQSLAVHVVVL